MTALPYSVASEEGADVARIGYRARRRSQRAVRRLRIARGAATIGRRGAIAPDPLARRRHRLLGRLAGPVALVLGSVVAHGLGLAAFAAVGELLRDDPAAGSGVEERLTVAVRRPPPPAKPPPLTQEKLHKKTRPRPAPKRAARPLPPPNPIHRQPQPTPAPRRRPRRIVGLSLESTTAGGGGPSFAVGNTRMGSTDAVARDPADSKTLALPKRNRKATFIPTAKSAFVPPRKLAEVVPIYPTMLEAQGLEADVVLSVTIGRDGGVTQVQVVGPSSHGEFNDAAIIAANKERYAPATSDGLPIEHTVQFTVRFRLTDY